MKLLEKRKELISKNLKTIREIKREYQKEKQKKNKEMKIIGITGSTGKSTTAVILHENLKALGYKSVLYSSAMVDSPASLIKKQEAYEVAVRTEEALLSIIHEAESYDTDYLILEVNESTIEKGFLNDIDFDVRVLTNLNPKHNLERYDEETYVSLKKRFFENINRNCKCVIGLQDYDKKLFEELLNLNDNKKLTFTSNYIASVKGINPSEITCLLTELDSSIKGLKMEVMCNYHNYKLETKLIGRHNVFNVMCVMTILQALNIFDYNVFKRCIKNIEIPGRSEVYTVDGKYVIIEPHMATMLETIKELKSRKEINKIRVVVGSMGYGYKNWDERLKTKEFIASRKKVRKYAMDLLKDNIDFVYLTETDNGKEKVADICQELQTYLEGKVPSVIIEDRRHAITQAIKEANRKDVILITGRGNRRVSCNSETTIKLVKDSEVVKQVIERTLHYEQK